VIDTRAQPQNGTQEGFFPSSRLPLEKEGSRKTARIHIDANGNLTSDGNGNTYAYDAANRMISVTNGSNVTGYVYNGFGKMVQETFNGAVIKQWVWYPDGTQPCEERNSSNVVTKKFYAQGERIDGTNYYCMFDHENSVRELTDANGNLVARYDYDPYGRRSQIYGTQSNDLADFGFTGFYFDQATGLDLTWFRAYDANLGRWLRRDPFGEAGGINLYQYGLNDPVDVLDPLGLNPHKLTIQSYIPTPTAWGFRGDNHGPTPQPIYNGYRTSSTVTFDDSQPGSSCQSNTGTSEFHGIYGQASPAGMTGSAIFIRNGVVRINMNGSASDPILLGTAPPAAYNLSLSLDFNSSNYVGSITRTDYPSFQVFLDGRNIYNYQAMGDPSDLFNQTIDMIKKKKCP
jgi:RHS repeat-associated protein